MDVAVLVENRERHSRPINLDDDDNVSSLSSFSRVKKLSIELTLRRFPAI